MSNLEIILAVSTAVFGLIGATITAFFAWMTSNSNINFKRNKDSDKARQEIELSKYEQQNNFYTSIISECEKLREGNVSLQSQIYKLQEEVHKLRDQLEFYERNHLASEAREMLEKIFNNFLTAPSWIHDISNNIWYLNDSYCSMFDIKRKSFWTPVNIFGRYDIKTAIDYHSNDLKVVEAGATVEFIESVRVSVMNPKCEDFIDIKIQKTPIIINERPYVIGKMLEQVF